MQVNSQTTMKREGQRHAGHCVGYFVARRLGRKYYQLTYPGTNLSSSCFIGITSWCKLIHSKEHSVIVWILCYKFRTTWLAFRCCRWGSLAKQSSDFLLSSQRCCFSLGFLQVPVEGKSLEVPPSWKEHFLFDTFLPLVFLFVWFFLICHWILFR